MTGITASFLQSTELFRGIETAAIESLLPAMRVVELTEGQALFSQGDEDYTLYLLMSGSLQVSAYNERKVLRVLYSISPGESAGEISILARDRASTSVRATADSVIAALSREAFEDFSMRYPRAGLQVMQALSARLQRTHLSITLRMSNIFDGLDESSLDDLVEELELRTFYAGEVLFRQGDSSDFLCLVVRGRVRVQVHENGGGEITVAELGPGETVGEMGVVTGERRTGTVSAARDTQVATLNRAGFERFMTRHPGAALQTITRKLAERLRDTTAGARPARRASNIAVVAAHEGAPVSAFCEAFGDVLRGFGKTAHLNSTVVDSQLGREGVAQTYERGGNNIRLMEWLSERELANEYMLYESDAFLSPWSERCVRQADIVLLVGDPKADPSPGPIEAELLESRDAGDRKREWLVLAHDTERPSGTARWLDARTVERHFHVRISERTSLERLARFLTGRALGLALGGGFARGLAHLGVFQALTDLGIGIDAVGGASMGAMIGALWAMGWSSDEIVRAISGGCRRKFDDLTFPFVAFKSGRNFSRLVRSLFGDVQIEDLWIPYFSISANLNRCELRRHTRGSLAKAMLAATRAPGLFPPVIYEGELHVDGGVINNVPVDLMKPFLNEGVTVGVDVSPPHELHPVRDYGDTIAGFPALWKRLNPFVKTSIFTPSILLVMIRTLEYSGMSYKETRLKYADVYMYPDMLKFKRTDFHRAGEILEAGRECARQNVLAWLARPEAAARRPDLARVRAMTQTAMHAER